MNNNSNGIGLTHSKRLAQQVLLGDLTLCDAYRDGCRFILTMILERVDQQKQSSYRLRKGKQFGSKKAKKTKMPTQGNGLALIPELEEEMLSTKKLEEIYDQPPHPEPQQQAQGLQSQFSSLSEISEEFESENGVSSVRRKPGKILVAEDQLYNMQVIKKSLEDLG